jgi:aldose 1-epimerase
MAIAAVASTNRPSVQTEGWGSVDSKPVYLFTLTNSNGVVAKITNYGGIVVEFHTPDRHGKMENIVLGLESLDEYLAGHPAFGCIVGRYINRIGGAKFTLDGTEYPLAANFLRKHNIHGGRKNFSSKVWDATASSDDRSATLSLSCLSADMEEGFPGNLKVRVDYVLNNDNELQIHYTATTDKPTVVSLSNHSYFNLTACKENVLNHQVRIYADAYTPTDDELIPTGEIADVEGTPYDLRRWTVINDRMIALPKGYDNNFCIKGTPGNPVLAAEMYEPKSGRLLQTFTTEPGLCFFTAHGLNTKNRKTPHGVDYTSSMGACFEAQHYPDSPNKPNFPSTVLRPGQTYRQLTIYKAVIK